MKKILLISAAIFLFACACSLQAHIGDDEKEIQTEFIRAKNFFHEGKADKTASILKGLAEHEHHPAFARVKASAAIADLLRSQHGKGRADGKLAEDLKKYIAELKPEVEQSGAPPMKKILEPQLAYAADTLNFLDAKKPLPARPENAEKEIQRLSREPRYAKASAAGIRILALGKIAKQLEKENPIESLLLDEQLWQESRKADFAAISRDAGAETAQEISAEVMRAAGHINTSYWARKFTYDLGKLPDVKILEEILKKFSAALAAKDTAKIQAMFHPASAFRTEILASIQSGELAALEYSGCGALQWGTNAASLRLTCSVKGTRTIQGKTETAEGNKTLAFRKDKNAWLLEQI